MLEISPGRRARRATLLAGVLVLFAACRPVPSPGTPAVPARPAHPAPPPPPTAPTAPSSPPPGAASAPAQRAPQREIEADAYTRYELLAPGSGQFRILYEITAVDPGALAYFNPIRKGSAVSEEAVYDRATGAPLAFAVVSGDAARAGGLPDADPATSYLRVELPRPVPGEGGVRLLIDKTYADPKSYRMEGDGVLVFDRPLGIRRNAVVLPPGFEVTSCNVPVQVLTESDGRVALSFMHTGPDAAPLIIRARRLAR